MVLGLLPNVGKLKLWVLLGLGLLTATGCGPAPDSEPPEVDAVDSTSNETASAQPEPDTARTASYQFEPPFRVEADGEPIEVDSPGFACPTCIDLDNDGAEDLVVGQFHDGAMRFYKNLALPHEVPRLTAAGWVMSGSQKAVVPGVW